MEQLTSWTTKLCPLVGASMEEAATEKRRQTGAAPSLGGFKVAGTIAGTEVHALS